MTSTISSAMTAAPMTFAFAQPLNAAGIGSSAWLGHVEPKTNMKTEIVRYVVQFKSVLDPNEDWRTYDDKYLSIPDAQKDLAALRNVNPNVRLIKRATTETVDPDQRGNQSTVTNHGKRILGCGS